MNYYTSQLQMLQAQAALKTKLKSHLKDLHRQQKELHEKISLLNGQRIQEQSDVERLEGHSLSAFFYNVIGKMDEKLDKERQEAYAAAVKYDTAVRELEAVEGDIRRYEAELKPLQNCQEEYTKVLNEKTAVIRASGLPEAAQILQLEERSSYIDNQKKEIQEAISAGTRALDTTKAVLSALNKAKGWGTFDLIGGGLVADAVKHGHLDEAQAQIQQLQIQLRRFKTELADITIHTDLQMNISEFLKFADFFFDSLFVDWMVLDKINQSQTQVLNTRQQIEEVLFKLDGMMDAARQKQSLEKEKLEKLILDLKI